MWDEFSRKAKRICIAYLIGTFVLYWAAFFLSYSFIKEYPGEAILGGFFFSLGLGRAGAHLSIVHAKHIMRKEKKDVV